MMAYDEEEREPITEPDTENRTHFHPQDVDAGGYLADGEVKQDKLKRLANLNSGMWNGKWENKKALHRQDNLHRLDALASSLELTEHQHRRSRTFLDKFPLGTFGYSADVVAFTICVLVAEQEGRDFDPTERVADKSDLDDVDSDRLFHKVALEEGYHYGQLETVINKVRDRGWKWGWW